MNRKGFGAVLDETVSQMEHDVRVLGNKQVTLKTNVKELEKTRDKLSSEIFDLESQHASDLKNNKKEIDSMMESAKKKLGNANLKESEASGKLAELNEKIEDCEKLTKSNQGTQKNLEIQNTELKEKNIKLTKLSNTISEVLKEL